MKAGIWGRLLVAVLVVLAPLVPLGPLTSPGVDDGSDEPTVGVQPTSVAPLVDVLDRLGLQPGTATSDRPTALVVVDLKAGARLRARQAIDVRAVYTRRGTRHVRGYSTLSDVRRLSRDPNITTVHIKSIDGPEAWEDRQGAPHGEKPAGVARVGVETLHIRGLRGTSVTVGVIDADFRIRNPDIATNVAAYRSFDAGAPGDGARPRIGSSTAGPTGAHGTAVASIVADTAPAADLHLAAIGPTTTPGEYERAVEWLEASGADVIVDAGSYPGQSEGGSGSLARIAANASEDAVFVTSAGNYARRHWAGIHGANEDDRWVDVAPGTEGNLLAGGEQISGRVTASVSWDTVARTNSSAATANATGVDDENGTATGGENGTATGGENRTTTGGENRTTTGGENRTTTGGENGTTTGGENGTTTGGENGTASIGDNQTTAGGETDGTASRATEYHLSLFRRQFGRDARVATSTGRAGEANTTHLDVVVPPGQYYLAIRAENATGTHHLSVFANRKLAHRNASGSLLAPATVPGVLTVGAYNGSGVAPYSSRGPVGNRSGVDLVAPATAPSTAPVGASGGEGGGGSSYAAPYVAGTAALLAAEYPDMTATEIRTVLRSSASEVGPAGVDAASGHGLLDADGAVALARVRTGSRPAHPADGTEVATPT